MSKPNYFDDAEAYDDSAASMEDPALVDPVVDFLAGLAGGGAALELGVGTGRIARPLSARGVRVHGIDLSPQMIARLRSKPGGDRVDTTVGDFSSTSVPGRYALVYLVFNTIMNLTSQEEQVECFRTAAAHLDPGGRFVIEVMVPALQRLPPGETARPFLVTETRLGFDEYDVVSQGLVSHHVAVENGAARMSSIPFRYVWPAELDLMARLGGMRLEGRWAGWEREPFTALSTSHVSVWQKD